MQKKHSVARLLIAFALGISCLGSMASSNAAAFSGFDVVYPTISCPQQDGVPIRGVDVSSVTAAEAAGTVFYNDKGERQDILKTLQEHGVNYIRVRVWNDPFDEAGHTYGGGNCDVKNAAEIGARAAACGMKLLVDFHYSDFWADPAKQSEPKAWRGYSLHQKQEAIAAFTVESLKTIRAAGADIGMVQVGNETNNFFCGVTGMEEAAPLFAAGCDAVRAFDPTILIALHFANPNSGHYPWYAKVLAERRVDYDVFATSYYPYWHGTTANMQSVLREIAQTYGKYVMVAETAYPYTDEDGDQFGNTVTSASDGCEFHYAISPAGQAACLLDVFEAVAGVGEKGLGVF